MLTAETIERILKENPDVKQVPETQHVDETGGSYDYEKLQAVLELWAQRNEGFEWIAANTSKGPGFRISCPGATGWPDGAVHSESSAPLNGSAVCWVENGHPRFTCKHAHCGEGTPLGKKTWRSLAEYYGRSAQREVLTGSPLLGLPVRPELPIAGQAPWDNAGPTTQGPAHAERGPEEWKPTGRTLLAGRTSAGVGLGVGQGSAAAEGHAVEIPVPNLHASPGVATSHNLKLTDSGNGWRFRIAYKDQFQHTPGGGWLTWDSGRWKKGQTAPVFQAAMAVASRIGDEADRVPVDPGDPKAAEKIKASIKAWAHTSQSKPRLDAMIGIAMNLPGITADVNDFDVDDYLFNCANGTLDLRSGQLYPHTRGHKLTAISPVNYHEDAECPLWTSFLEKVMQGDAEMIRFLQCAVGYTLTGNIDEQCFFINYGNGSNGKSTFVETLQWLLGDYSEKADMRTFRDSKDEGVRNDLAKLRTARMVVASELAQAVRLNEPLIKEITGGEGITARFLFKELFTFRPKFKIWMSTNFRPLIGGTDEGIWRRVKLVKWDHTFRKEPGFPDSKDKTFPAKLRGEGPGILRWAVDGWRECQKTGGLFIPAGVVAATEEYRAQEDFIGKWISDNCEQGTSFEGSAQDLFHDYSQTAVNAKEKPISAKIFKSEMERRGYQSKHTKHGNVFVGVKLSVGKAW